MAKALADGDASTDAASLSAIKEQEDLCKYYQNGVDVCPASVPEELAKHTASLASAQSKLTKMQRKVPTGGMKRAAAVTWCLESATVAQDGQDQHARQVALCLGGAVAWHAGRFESA